MEREILDSDKNQQNHVVLKDVLRETKSIGFVEKNLEDDTVDRDLKNDVIGAKYLQMENSVPLKNILSTPLSYLCLSTLVSKS